MRISILLVSVAVSFLSMSTGAAVEGYTSISTVNFAWYRNNDKRINDLLKKGTDSDVVPVVNTLGSIWAFRDGSMGSEVAPAIARSFIYRPEITFLWFRSHPQQFDSWLNDLPSVLLTDYEGTGTEELDALRRALMSALGAYLKVNKDAQSGLMADQFLEKLRNTEVRVVD